MVLFTFVINDKFQAIVGKDTADISAHGIVPEMQEEITGTPCAFRDKGFGPCKVGEGVDGSDLINSAKTFNGPFVECVNVQKISPCFGFNGPGFTRGMFTLIGILSHNKGNFQISRFLLVQSMALQGIINGGFTYLDTIQSQFIRDSLRSNRGMLFREIQDMYIYFLPDLKWLFSRRACFIGQCQFSALQEAIEPVIKGGMADMKLTSEFCNG